MLVGMGQDAGQPLRYSLQFFMGAIVLMVVSGVVTHVELFLRAQIVIALISIFFLLRLEGYLGWRNDYLFEFVNSCSVVGVGNSLSAAFATTFCLVLFRVAHL